MVGGEYTINMKIEWNKVTWYSKLIALALFVALPFMPLTVQTSPTQDLSTVTWNPQAGRTYQVEYSSDLLSWFAAPTGEVTAAGPAAQWIDRGPPGTASLPFHATQRFYRVFQFGSP